MMKIKRKARKQMDIKSIKIHTLSGKTFYFEDEAAADVYQAIRLATQSTIMTAEISVENKVYRFVCKNITAIEISKK